MAFAYRYPRPGLAVDAVVARPDDESMSVLLVERGEPPFEGDWATPGGFVDIGHEEQTAEAVRRELLEETDLEELEFHQFGVFDAPDRDPRGRIVSVAFWALAPPEIGAPTAGDDAADARWHRLDELPSLAFDHDRMVDEGVAALRRRARTGPVGRTVLEAPFQIEELRNLYAAILESSIDLDSFEERVLDSEMLVETDGGYRFDDEMYEHPGAAGPSLWHDASSR